MQERYRIRFPRTHARELGQDAAFFFLDDGGETQRIRFHDYDAIYKRPGLYEQLFHDRLNCASPNKVASILESAISQAGEHLAQLRVLDLGAGNGMVGLALQERGVARIVGVDIIPEAREAAERDRPGVYDAYHVADFTQLDRATRDDLASWNLECLVTVAALGFGDIPIAAFVEAFNVIGARGWIAFNIKDTFLDEHDATGFSRLVRRLILSEYLELHHMERYRHRRSMDGEPLTYYAIAGRKRCDVPSTLIAELECGD